MAHRRTTSNPLNVYQYTASYDVFLLKELPFDGSKDCIGIKIFSGVNFVNRN